MSLVTRCPHCATAFKVVADQLRVRNGLVRCGVCNTVFDGRACLVTPGGPVNQAPVPVIEQALPEPAAPVSIPPPPPPPPPRAPGGGGGGPPAAPPPPPPPPGGRCRICNTGPGTALFSSDLTRSGGLSCPSTLTGPRCVPD
ncbi:MJ0042-type zinc finger domain-containing protein [Bordetella avium]|uniref:MJ0042-type zinc finger domain-containing protein n=1 Tax=Bordetella avium TaxID=521 RepID=UPI003B50A9E1